MDRRQRIANAGIALIARGGTHRLTHRAVDTEAGLPNGSTSYYARSRRDLIRLVMEQLSAESQADLTDIEVPGKLTVRQATDLVGRLAERLILNGDAQAARFALMFEVRDDDELRRELTVDAPVRRSFDEKAVELLRASARVVERPGRVGEVASIEETSLLADWILDEGARIVEVDGDPTVLTWPIGAAARHRKVLASQE